MTALPSDPHRRYTIEEYARLEELSEVRHEYHDGEILAMSGGSYAHALIATNINGELRTRLKGSPCHNLDANMRIATPRRMYYADGSIVCGPPTFDLCDPTGQSMSNPRGIIEVLSPSTEPYDRNKKLFDYAAIPSFEEMIFVHQDEPHVESHVQQPDGSWSVIHAIGIETKAVIRCVHIEIPLTEIYANVPFQPPA